MTDIAPAPLLDCVELQTGADAAPAWTILWLHGLGADGHDFAPIVPQLIRSGWPTLRFVFPHAPVREVTFSGGARMRAWYDLINLSPEDLADRADQTGVAESVGLIECLIAREAERGIPPHRLILVGFSQGGAITLSVGLRRAVPLAGLVALSTYLPGMHKALPALSSGAERQPLFMAHGRFDPVIPCVAGEATAGLLTHAGFAPEWHTYPMAHQVCPEEIRDLGDWLQARFDTV